MKQRLRTAIMIWIVTISAYVFGQSEWQLVKDNQGIQVFVRTNDTTKFKEFKAQMEVPAHPEEVLNVIWDGDHLYEWHYQTSESKLIRKINNNQQVVYMRNDLPWPLQDREVYTLMKLKQQTPQIFRIDLLPSSGNYDFKNKIIRIKNFKGHWYLEQSPKGTIVIQEMQGDPGGSIPPFLFNIFLANGPFSTFLELKNKLNGH